MYQVLYRKWRPSVFEDVVGQPQVTVTLRNELTQGRLAHAYLFTGSRGTGKTTCAKILAKAVNCLHPVSGDPCNECEICRGIDDGSILDIVEIDAASNNGVDNIRNLREEAAFMPSAAKMRVFIIDEVHMLSIGAFNALLKTLEEPPAYVLFILATTEAHKIPATILSRCQRFDFHRIAAEGIAARLLFVAEQEKVSMTKEAALLIARLADGGMRDALSLLDQCIGDGEITEARVAQTAGLAGREHVFRMADALLSKDTAQVLEQIDRLYAASRDMTRLCEELIEHFRSLLLIKTMGSPEKIIVCPTDELTQLKKTAQQLSAEDILHILSSLQNALERLAYASNRRVELELALIRICTPGLDTSTDALLRRIKALENAIRAGVPIQREGQTPVKVPQTDTKSETAPPASEQAASSSVPVEQPSPQIAVTRLDCWPEVLEELSQLAPPLRGALEGSRAFVSGSRVLIDAPDPFVLKLINEEGHKQALRTAILHQTGRVYALGPYQKQEATAVQQADPIDALLERAKSAGIPVTVSE